MKFLILFTTLLMASAALAAPHPERLKELVQSESECGSFIRFDDSNLYIGFGNYKRALENPRLPIPNKLKVVPVDGAASFTLQTNDSAIDLVTEGRTAFLLTHSSIEEWDLPTRERVAEHATYNYSGVMAQKEHSMAFARYKNKLIIAHGRLGISFFDMNQKKITNQFRLLQRQWPLESMAMGVTVQGRYAYVMMDNYHLTSPAPFRGIIIVDLETETVVSELDGMDPGVTTVTSDSQFLIVSFAGNPVWKYRLSSLQGKTSLPAPLSFIRDFPLKGHPTGSAAMDERYYYTCFFKAPAYKGENGGVWRKVPAVLDRHLLMMD